MELYQVSDQMNFAVMLADGQIITRGTEDDGHDFVAQKAVLGTLKALGQQAQLTILSPDGDLGQQGAASVLALLSELCGQSTSAPRRVELLNELLAMIPGDAPWEHPGYLNGGCHWSGQGLAVCRPRV